MNKSLWLSLLALILVGVVAFLAYNQPRQTASEGIRIGGAFALTGFAATWGEADRNGAILAVEELNAAGNHVELISEDTFSDNNKMISAITKLIDIDNVDVVVGPTWMDTFLGAAPIADDKHIVVMTPSAAITAVKQDKNYENVFSTWYRSDTELQKIPAYLASQQIKKLVIITSQDSFWVDVAINLKKTLGENGVQLLLEERVNPASTDLRSTISKIKQLNPDAVFFGFNSEQNLTAFLRQKQELGLASPLYTTESIEEFASDTRYEELLLDVEFVAPKVLDSTFYENYENRFGVKAIYSASNAYDAVRILVEAISTGNTTDAEIRNYLLTHEFDTVTFGKIKFDEIGGVTGGNFVIKKIGSDGIKIIVDPL